jgi:hypothetical protein
VSSAAPPAAARPTAAARAAPARAPAPETHGVPPAGEHALALHPGTSRTPLAAPPPPPPGAKTLRRAPAGGRGGDADRRAVAGVYAEGAGGAEESVRSVIGAGGGRPLDPATRAFFEAGFGAGLEGVRVHTGPRADASARAVDALAYTVGRDVVFRAGRYAPESGDGRRLLAHELAHVVQGAGTPQGPAPLRIGGVDEPAERNAEAAASAVLGGARAPAAMLAPQPAVVRRQPTTTPPAPAAPATTPPPAPTRSARVIRGWRDRQLNPVHPGFTIRSRQREHHPGREPE